MTKNGKEKSGKRTNMEKKKVGNKKVGKMTKMEKKKVGKWK